MEYGATKTTQVLDDQGSTETIVENFHGGDVVKPVRKMYEVKTRVRSQKEEHAVYLDFSDEILRNKTMLDPSFRIEHTKVGNENGFYYTVKCYTVLVY